MAAYTEEAREAELSRLMTQYGDSIKRLCYIYLHSLSAAEDAAQDTFIKSYQHIDDLLDGSIANEKAWILRIAVNTCKDELRSSWMRHIDKRKTIDTLPLSVSFDHDSRIDLTRAVWALPVKYRELVLLYYYQDLNLRTCAGILGISPATATRRLQQAQKKLRTTLEGG